MSLDLKWDGTTEDGFMIPPPGVYLAEVDLVESKKTKQGDTALVVQLRDVGSRVEICRDWLMLTGGGRGIGMAKLRQLGVPEGTPKLEPLSLVGRRVRVAIKHEPYDGKPTAKVDIAADGFRCGYLAAEEQPPAAPDTPF